MKLIAILIATMIATPVMAATCGPTDQVIATLHSRYGEVEVNRALAADGSLMLRWFSNPETGTWTMLAKLAGESISCVFAAGSDFTAVNSVTGDPA